MITTGSERVKQTSTILLGVRSSFPPTAPTKMFGLKYLYRFHLSQ